MNKQLTLDQIQSLKVGDKLFCVKRLDARACLKWTPRWNNVNRLYSCEIIHIGRTRIKIKIDDLEEKYIFDKTHCNFARIAGVYLELYSCEENFLLTQKAENTITLAKESLKKLSENLNNYDDAVVILNALKPFNLER